MPPPPPSKINDELQAFLAWNQQQVAEGYTIANVMLAQKQFEGEIRGIVSGLKTQILSVNGRVSDLETDRESVHTRLDHHGAAIIAIKRRVRHGADDDEMDTGQFDLKAIQTRLAEQEKKRAESERVRSDDQVWWKRSIIMWLVGGFGVVAVTLLSVLITMAIANSTPRGERTLPAVRP
jgi:hypothetical protein